MTRACFAGWMPLTIRITLARSEYGYGAGFAEAEVDLAILEVGMGGRLDAVNLVDGLASAVVSISRDHEAFLGSELHQIAGEIGVAEKVARVFGRSLHPLGRAEATERKFG